MENDEFRVEIGTDVKEDVKIEDVVVVLEGEE